MPEYRFNPAPGWPIYDPEWVPDKGWRPNAEWPVAPEGWQFWVEVVDPYAPPKDAVLPFQYAEPPRVEPPTVQPVQISPRAGYNGIPIVYNRQQRGHSVVLNSIVLLLLFGWVFNSSSALSVIILVVLLGRVAYYAVSPNHYWRL